jgi:hypothetical protein
VFILKPCIDCAWLLRGKLVPLFMLNNRVRVQHRSAAAARGCCWTLFLRHKTVSTERAQHIEIPFQRDKEPLRFGSTRAKFVRGNMVSILRGKAMNTASRGSREQSIPGFKQKHFSVPNDMQ